MDRIATLNHRANHSEGGRVSPKPFSGEGGFSLIETMIAMAILATSLLSLAAVFAMGIKHLANSTPNLIAREKAREAVESVHTARDTRILTWAQINNVAQGGVFLPDALQVRRPGVDGLVNTADDAVQPIEEIIAPGTDGLMGTVDDIRTPLTHFRRQIQIAPVLDAAGVVIPSIRQLRVTVTYSLTATGLHSGTGLGRYVLTTYISSIS